MRDEPQNGHELCDGSYLGAQEHNRSRKRKGEHSARMVEANGKSTFLARVPAILTTIPEIPDVVMCEGKFFTLTTTVPMTYTQRLYAEAVRI